MLDHEKLDVYQNGMRCYSRCLNVLKIIQPPLFDEGKQLLHRIVSMLTKMCRRIH